MKIKDDTYEDIQVEIVFVDDALWYHHFLYYDRDDETVKELHQSLWWKTIKKKYENNGQH